MIEVVAGMVLGSLAGIAGVRLVERQAGLLARRGAPVLLVLAAASLFRLALFTAAAGALAAGLVAEGLAALGGYWLSRTVVLLLTLRRAPGAR